jgi:hypothetical protein
MHVIDYPGPSIKSPPPMTGLIILRTPRRPAWTRNEHDKRCVIALASQLRSLRRQCSYKNARDVRCMARGALNLAHFHLQAISFREHTRLERWVDGWE